MKHTPFLYLTWKRILGLCFFLCNLAFLGLWLLANSFSSPSRRQLQQYHLSYLDQPDSHGLIISQHEFLDGKVPTLITLPDPVAGPAERGALIRKQLLGKGTILPSYGNHG